MITIENSVLLLVDVQEKLTAVMQCREELIDALQRLIKGIQALEIPVIWMEQIPEKMGPTIPELRDLLNGQEPISKACFSCYGVAQMVEQLEKLNSRHVIVCGIEAHVCVYQTADDLLRNGYKVEIAADAVSTRTAANKQIALDHIRQLGGNIKSVEMLLLELARTAEHPAFRKLLKIVK